MGECLVCGKEMTLEERENNTCFCDDCERNIEEEKKNIKDWHEEEDEIVITDIPLFNQKEFNKLFKKYPTGDITSDFVEPFRYESYEDGVLNDYYSTEKMIFAFDEFNPNAMIPVVSIRKTIDNIDRIFIEKYMTKNEYEVEYLGKEDKEDKALYEINLK